MSETGKPPTLQEIAEAQGLTFVEGVGIYSETGDLLLQLHPDPEGLIDGLGYAIPEVVGWGYTSSKEDDDGSFTWATVYTYAPDMWPYVHYFIGLDPKEDTDSRNVTCWGDVPDLRELVAEIGRAHV